jgi:carbon monoxide dehydrogenase subunit G
MAHVEASITTKRPIDEVFAALSDWTNSEKWISSTQSVTKTSDGPIGVGTTWSTVGKLLGRTLEADITATEFEPDQKSAWVVDKPFKATTTFTLKSVDGGTRVDQTTDAELEGFFKLAQAVMLPMMKRQLQNDLETFRDLMDANAL